MHFKRLAEAFCYAEETVQSPPLARLASDDDCLDDNAASELVSGALSAAALAKAESHLAICRDCRALVAALAGDDADSNALTHRHERIAEDSQVGKRPVLSIGDRVGRYLVLASLGAGGMGVVFAAYDPQLDRKVALKLLRANLGANAKEARTRLKREAQAIAQLSHPNVVGVYDVGTTNDGDVYIAMEFVEGDTLTTWLRRWPRTWREIIEVFQQAARGLMAAHSVGLLHRDFKPDNVLVGGDGRVRVTDFGLARSLFVDEAVRAPHQTPAAGSPLQVDLTATGTVLGTPRYMPPEQLTGPSIDARADQFSFCVALYEALYGTHPLPGATSVAMLEHDERALAPPEATKVPPSIGRAVMRGLEKERSKRFPTLAALMHELTPAPQRSPVRFIALAAIGVLAVTVATAAMMTRGDNKLVVEPLENNAVKVLIDEINRKDQEIKSLRKKLLDSVQDREEIVILKKQLDDAQEQSRKLLEQLVEIKQQQQRAASVKVGLPPPPPQRVDSKQVTAAIQSVYSSVEFCLDDLDSRVEATEGAPKSRDIDAVVRLSTTPDGKAFDVRASRIDYSPSVRMCIEDALKRVDYPKGPETLDLRIDIAWAAGFLSMTARVVDHRDGGPGAEP